MSSGILWADDNPVYRMSVFTEVLIHLKDLCIKANDLGKRLTSTQDVVIRTEKPKIQDVTDLISNFRDAACHMDTFRKHCGEKAFSFVEIRGKGVYRQYPDIQSEYEDDIAFIMGENILYLKRHIEKSFDDLKPIFKESIGTNFFNFAIQLNGG